MEMDLKRWYQFRFTYLFLFILSANNVLVRAKHKCLNGGATGFLGYTYPSGDILIESGADLDIICVLSEKSLPREKLSPFNASSSLIFSRNKEDLPDEMIDIVNGTSIRLHVKRPVNVSNDAYHCKLRNSGKAVCYNSVSVGVKPQMISDFDCISQNYQNLTCSWTAPQNYVETTYKLSYRLQGRAGRAGFACPEMKNEKDGKMSCFWNISTSPIYRQVHELYYFTLQMNNTFGTNEYNYTFKHFEHVLSDPPVELTATNNTTSSIFLKWSVPPPMENFPKGVQARILYQCEYGEKEWQLGGITGINVKAFNLTGLKYAHALCDIRVSLRSSVATEERMWSKNASITVRTSPKVPDRPPRTQIGSFETTNLGRDMQYREVYLYWWQIDENERNGPDFSYEVVDVSDPTRKPRELTSSYAKFSNLSMSKSYTFYIWSKNSKGRSEDQSIIHIPMKSQCLPEPQNFIKEADSDNRFELSWESPRLRDGQSVVNYTIFRCANKKDRPYQCTGQLSWTVVPADKFKHNETVLDNKTHQFAISANSHNSSSGMHWAECTILLNHSVSKLKTVWISRLGSTFMNVAWKLDCADAVGAVKGFIIYYCPTVSPPAVECKEPQKNVTFMGNVREGMVTGLKPYTTYMLTVTIITKGESFSQTSDPLMNTTFEAAPSTPPQNFRVTNVTNSSISLAWDRPAITNGQIKLYLLRLNSGEPLTINPDQNTTKLDNLGSFKRYNISISACTISCSNSTYLDVTTEMGYPGKISQPTIKFQDNENITIIWNRPSEPNGRNDYFEVKIKKKLSTSNISVPVFNVSGLHYTIENCGDSGSYNTFYISVRAINVIDKVSYPGEWSDELVSYCQSPGSYLIFILLAVAVLFGVGVFMFRKLYKQCKIMRDVEVKLPPGLAPAIIDQTLGAWSSEKLPEEDRESHTNADEQLLLVKMTENRHLSGDSSGCSSGNESVTSSLESGTHISSTSDSGTEQAATGYLVVSSVMGLNPKLGVVGDAAPSPSPYVPVVDISDKLPPSAPACENIPKSSPYVMAAEPIKTPPHPINSGYISYNAPADYIGKQKIL